MGETGIHVHAIVQIYALLREFFRARRENVYVAANMFLYYLQGQPDRNVVPDVFIAFGVENAAEERRTWKVWEEKQIPAVVFEITSKSTQDADLGIKKGLYEWLGVQEYFVFDPLGEYLYPRLQGFQLVDGYYQPIPQTGGQELQLGSEALSLELRAEGAELRFFDPATGEYLLTLEEMAAELAQLRSELARLRGR